MLSFGTIVLLIAAFTQVLTLKNPNNRADNQDFRLPGHIVPKQYFIKLEPDFTNDVFNGSVAMEFEVLEESSNITLHAYQLEIDSSKIALENSSIEFSNSYQSDGDDNFYVINFSSTLKTGTTYTLTIGSFSGILNDEKIGFYLAKYTDEYGTERYK